MEAPLDSATDCLELHFLDIYSPRPRKQSFTNLMPETCEVPPHFDSLCDSFSGWSLPGMVLPLGEECYLESLPLEPRPKRANRQRPPKPAPRAPEPLPVARQVIGTLTSEQRQIRIRRFLEKRKRRVWTKKISYDCRKRVADGRLRVKGRFVTKTQAQAALEQRSPQVS